MNFEYLTLNVAERVATVTINRPDKGNALAPDVLEHGLSCHQQTRSHAAQNAGGNAAGEQPVGNRR